MQMSLIKKGIKHTYFNDGLFLVIRDVLHAVHTMYFLTYELPMRAVS